ncbi:MAG: hypothetical protein L6R35_002194 [Caloplaca aegaea]|nr:MAG: hypothetical protein L6R35_002194 [Caloplaca aegaea]
MQIAAILSDLTSLRVCDHSAALALVSTRAPPSDTSTIEYSKQERPIQTQGESDPDMQRALDLLELHHDVKMKHVKGEDRDLMQARKEVDTVLARLESQSGKQDVRRR